LEILKRVIGNVLIRTNDEVYSIVLFKDRLEIWNPGSLPYGLTTAKLRKPHSSIPANPLLAEPMYLAGFIERMGTGTGDIIRLCQEAGLKKAPEFLQEEIFKTILWRKNAEEPSQQANVVDNVVDTIAKKEQKIIKFISENKKITAKEIALKLELTQRTVQRYLKSMQEKELIKRIGTDNSGYWELVLKDE
jgi:ATP-dependent DNA helicase RecG